MRICQHLTDSMASDMLAKGEPSPVPYHFRGHYTRFKCRSARNDAVRMDSTLVREGIVTDNRLDRENANPRITGD